MLRKVAVSRHITSACSKCEIHCFHDHPACQWLFEIAGGAIADFDDTCLPKEKREAAFTIAALHQWPMGVDEPRCVEVAEDVSFFRHHSRKLLC
jgi:hypothetical protein